MLQTNFYNAFNMLYEAVKDGISIFQKENLYRLLFRDVYLMANDDLYDNDTIRKITSGNNTIHRKAVKQLCTDTGFDALRRNIETVCLPKLAEESTLIADLASLLKSDINVPEVIKTMLINSVSEKNTYKRSRAIAGILLCLDHSDYMVKTGITAFIDIKFMRLSSESPIPVFPRYITVAPNAAVDELVGRQTELKTLQENILGKHEKLIISAVGGLGKTELVKLFLHNLIHTETKYSGIEEIAWVPYDNHDICLSLKQALHLQCELDEVWQKVQDKASELQRRLLIVIDNIENPDNDEYLQKLASLQCLVVVTSRQRQLAGFSNIMYLQPLSMDGCRQLFYKHYQFNERDNEVLNDIINLTAKLTIMIVFIAKVAYLEGLSLHKLYGNLVAKGFKLSEEDVSCEHEKLQDDETIIRQMCILFSLVNYNEADKVILTHISIIPNLQFDFPKAKAWFKIKKNSSLMKLFNMGMLEHVTRDKKHIYWMHSVIAAAIREQQKEHLYELSRPFVDILSEELNTGPVFGKEYEKAYLIPFSWSVADIMEEHWCIEDDTDFLTSLFHICFACSNYSLCERLIDSIIRVQTDNHFPALDLAYSYRNKIDLLLQFDKVDEAGKLFPIVDELLSSDDIPEDHKDILHAQRGIYFQIRGDFKTSRYYLEKCITAAEEETSETRNKDMSTAYTNMARMLVEAGDFFEAYKYAKKAIEVDNDDETDADRIICFSTLAGICTELMQAGFGTTYVQEAMDAFDKVIKFREKYLGMHHADTAVIYHDYAYFWYVCGVLDRALEYNEKAYQIEEELFSEYSITRMRSLNTRALIIWDQEKYQDADEIFEYIIDITEKMNANFLPDLAYFEFNYARCLHEQGKDEKAKINYLKCIDIWCNMSKDGNRNLALANQEYGEILFSEAHAAEAIPYFENARKYNKEDFYVEVDVIDSLAACLFLSDRKEESIQLFVELIKLLVEYKVHDAETKYQLCNNLVCILDPNSEDEETYKGILLAQIEDDAMLLEYIKHYFDDLPQKT